MLAYRFAAASGRTTPPIRGRSIFAIIGHGFAQEGARPRSAGSVERPAHGRQTHVRAAPLRTSPAAIHRLQRSIGNRAVATLLSRTPTGNVPSVQRDIGFELENPMIHLRQVADAEKIAEAGRAGGLSEKEWPPTAPSPLRAKEPVLTLGEGPATLEADDTLGVGREDVEIVVPRLAPYDRGFPLTDKGFGDMVGALRMAEKFALSAGALGTRHAIEVEKSRKAARDELEARREQWVEANTGTRLLKNKELSKAATGKQSPTAPLGPVTDFTKGLKKVRQHEKAVAKNKADPKKQRGVQKELSRIQEDLVDRGLIQPEPSHKDLPTFRTLTAVSELWSGGGDLVLGDAGHADGPWVVHVTMGIPLKGLNKQLSGSIGVGSKALKHLDEKKVPQGPELAGFMRLVASYLWGAEQWKAKRSKNPKQAVGLLARNSFAAMFTMLPSATRVAIAREPDTWVAAWAKESNLTAPFLINLEARFRTEYTREEWLRAMIGTVSGDTHTEGFDLISGDESLDSMGKWTQFDSGKDGAPIPILEDRLYENWHPGAWVDKGCEHFKRNLSLLED